MTAVSSKELVVAVDVENLYLGVRRSRQDKMIRRRDESKSVDRFCAMLPRMYELPRCRLVPLLERG